jgi:hypothetical protein
MAAVLSVARPASGADLKATVRRRSAAFFTELRYRVGRAAATVFCVPGVGSPIASAGCTPEPQSTTALRFRAMHKSAEDRESN